jgi:hypothetical protein
MSTCLAMEAEGFLVVGVISHSRVAKKTVSEKLSWDWIGTN